MFLISAGYVKYATVLQDIQYHNVVKTKVTVRSNGQSVLNRNPNLDVMLRIIY